MDNVTIFGSVEKVKIPAWDIEVLAKIDTGAFSGALHADDIRVFTHEGQDILAFKPLDSTQEVQVREFTVRKVRSAFGHATRRYLIPVTVSIEGKEYDTVIGLTDRQNMAFPIIIGRRMLNQYKIVVDVRKNDHLRPSEGVY